MKEIKGLNKLKDSLSSWIRRLKAVKMTTPPKVICRFSAILIKSPMAFCFCRSRKTYPKIQIAKTILIKKES